jgi:aminomethyltransferase
MIEDVHGNPIGVVTSGTHSPSLDVPIGLGYLPANMVKPGTEIYVVAGNKRIKAVTTKLPFYSVG